MRQAPKAPTKKATIHWRTRLDAIINALFPGTCQRCSSRANGVICMACSKDLVKPLQHCCSICAIPMTHTGLAGENKLPSNTICPECSAHPPSYTVALCGLIYDASTDHIVRQFKDRYGFQWLPILCSALIAKVDAHYGKATHTLPELLVPMPLHWRKSLLRGYNQSELIAAELSHTLARPIFHGLKKVRATATQHNLNRRLRIRNVLGSLACKGDIQGKHLALVDDVMTTGSTAECAAQVLREAGASRVDIWALARTPKPMFN